MDQIPLRINQRIYKFMVFFISLINKDHLYFIEDQNAKVTGEIAVWNCVITHGLRPKKILIII